MKRNELENAAEKAYQSLDEHSRLVLFHQLIEMLPADALQQIVKGVAEAVRS